MSYLNEIKLKGLTGNLADVNSENQLHVVLRGKVDSNNSSSTPLAIAGVFTGISTDILDYGIIFISVYSDVDSATDGLSLQQSSDGTNWDIVDVYSIKAGVGKTFSVQPACKYFRVVYTNGAVIQTAFRLSSVLKKTNSKPSSHRLIDAIKEDDDAELVIAVIKGQNPAGTYIDFKATTSGNFKISMEELENAISVNSNSQLRITPFDSVGVEHPSGVIANPEHVKLIGSDYVAGVSGIDAVTEVPITIDYEHHEIHSGSEYRAGFQKDIPNGGTAAFEITTPNTTTWAHFKLAIDIELEAEVAFYENPDVTTSGTSVTPRNANRNVADASVMVCSSDPTYTLGSAIPLGKRVIGSQKSIGGLAASVSEWILKQNTSYLVVVTNQATGASNECNIMCRWYEHANKN